IVLAYTGDGTPGLPDAAHRSPVPVRLLALPEIPRTDGGDVDQAQLLAAATTVHKEQYVEPANDLERQLAQLWAEVLGRPRIGREARFFDLGGSSLRAAQLVARTNSALGASLLVHQLYEHPTVGELAAVLAKELKG